MSLLLPNEPLGGRAYTPFTSFENFSRDVYLGADIITDLNWTIPAYANGSFVGICNGFGMNITLPAAIDTLPPCSYATGGVPADFWNGWHIWLRNVCPGTAVITIGSPSTVNGASSFSLLTNQAVGIFAVRGNYLTFGPF